MSAQPLDTHLVKAYKYFISLRSSKGCIPQLIDCLKQQNKLALENPIFPFMLKLLYISKMFVTGLR